MRLNDLSKEAFKIASEKGWWEPEVAKKPLECHALMVSEIAEAMEEWRAKKPDYYIVSKKHNASGIEEGTEIADEDGILNLHEKFHMEGHPLKPEGEAVELADALIRIADYFGYRGWDLEAVVRAKMDYNKTRSKMHGGKRA